MNSLWNHAKNLLKLFTPVYLILRLSDQGGQAMAILDGKMQEARERMIHLKQIIMLLSYASATVSSYLMHDGSSFVALCIVLGIP